MLVSVVDVETTGLDINTSKTIEIACVTFCTTSRCIVDAVSCLIPADSNEAFHINHIPPQALLTHNWVRTPLIIAIRDLIERSEVIIAHNSSFDQPRLDQVFVNHQLPATMPEKWVCSLKDITFPSEGNSKKLSHLAIDHGLVHHGAHRALSDSIVLTELLLKVDNLEDQIIKARLPKRLINANGTPFDKNDIIKSYGFRWNAQVKQWQKEASDEEINKIVEDGLIVINLVNP